jgi:hypothetical protein
MSSTMIALKGTLLQLELLKGMVGDDNAQGIQ